MVNEETNIFKQLNRLRQEHRSLDSMIGELMLKPFKDQIKLQRLKKKRLNLRTKINELETMLYPDIVA